MRTKARRGPDLSPTIRVNTPGDAAPTRLQGLKEALMKAVDSSACVFADVVSPPAEKSYGPEGSFRTWGIGTHQGPANRARGGWRARGEDGLVE